MTEEEKAGCTGSRRSYRKKFEEAMDDDFNTADAIAAVFELVKFVNTIIQPVRTAKHLSAHLHDDRLCICAMCLDIIVEKKEELLDSGYREADRGASGGEKRKELCTGQMRSVMSFSKKESFWKIPEKE